MNTALIGYTGFVGSNINRNATFDELYNSKNIEDIKNREFELVVCAGVPAVKWWANQNPQEDLQVIESLIHIFKTIKARRFVLISTVDVYPNPITVNENTSISLPEVAPYGKHRLMLERALEGCFDNLHVVRLPGLFGKGLKKNIFFDMLKLNMVESINLESSFQWYPLSRIWDDIQRVISNEISLINFAVEPIATSIIKERFFNSLVVGSNPNPKAIYDMHTIYGDCFGQASGDYIMNREQVMDEIESWLRNPEVNGE